MKIFIAGLLLLSTSQVCAGVTYVPRCGGGEGPHPLLDITSQFSIGSSVIDTKESVRELLVSEKRNQLIYRTDTGRVIAHPLNDSHPIEKGFSPYPLSRIIDEERGLIAAKDMPLATSLDTLNWLEFPLPKGKVQNVFWKDGVLYTVLQMRKSTQTRIYTFDYQNNFYSQRCYTSNMLPARGSSFPYVYYYGESMGYDGRHLVVYSVDVRSCSIVHSIEFAEPLSGPLEEVHVFRSLNAVAAKVKHPRNNLLWYRSNQGCSYYDINGGSSYTDSRLLVLNYKQPLLGAFSPRNGLSLLNFAEKNRARLPNIAAWDIPNAYLTDNGRELFLTLRRGEGPHPLLHLLLP